MQCDQWASRHLPERWLPRATTLLRRWSYRRVAGLADLSRPRTLSLRRNLFLAQKHLSEPLMITEPELSFCRGEVLGEGLRRAVFCSTNTNRTCTHNSHCRNNRD